MPEYTYKDVIIDPEDPRVEIGKEYWAGSCAGSVIDRANENRPTLLLRDVEPDSNSPFFLNSAKSNSDMAKASCIIRKKDPKKRYVPFDLSDPDVRKSLRGRWIESDGDESQITGFHQLNGEEWVAAVANGYVTDEILYSRWKFEDGSPCGRLVEDE